MEDPARRDAAPGPYAARVGWEGPLPTYPVFLVGLARRSCLVVGGGRIAADKVRGLLDGGANRIDVISPRFSAEMEHLAREGPISLIRRGFRPGDLAGVFLVIAATDDPGVNRQVFAEAEARGVLVNVVDDPPHCTFIAPSVVRRGHLTVAISTGGACPALAARLRQELEQQLGSEYAAFVALAGEIRPTIMDRLADPEARRRVWYDIVDSAALDLLRAGAHEAARGEVHRVIAAALAGEDPHGR